MIKQTKKRLLIIEIPEEQDLHKDFETKFNKFSCMNLMCNFKSYVVDPNHTSNGWRQLEAIKIFLECKDFTMQIRSRFKE